MPKKKRSRKRSTYRKNTAARSAASVAASVSAPPPPKEVDFSTEYQYVLGDLRHIAILAAAMFATLITLSLIIN